MKREELLKLKEGVYILTDEICNYKYLLYKYDTDSSYVGSLYNYFSFTSRYSDSLSLYYDLISSYDEDYDESNPNIKKMSVSSNIGGMRVIGKYAYRVLNDLQLIGPYQRETLSKDFAKFKLNYKIGLCKYDRLRLSK